MSEISGDDLAEFIELTGKKRLAQAEMKGLNGELAEIEERLLEQFADVGIKNIKVNGHTIYLHTRFVAKAKDGDRARAIVALKSAGLEEYLTFNSSQITSYFNEKNKNGEDNLAELVDAFEFDNIFSIRARKG